MKNRDMQIHPMGKVFFFVEVSTHQISRDESWYFLHCEVFKNKPGVRDAYVWAPYKGKIENAEGIILENLDFEKSYSKNRFPT